MSKNDIYNILNSFTRATQEPQAEENKAEPAKTKLQESIEQVSEKYMGWKKTVASIEKGGSAENPEAVAAAIGRKKYGKKKFQAAAAAGKKLGEDQVDEGYQDRIRAWNYDRLSDRALRKSNVAHLQALTTKNPTKREKATQEYEQNTLEAHKRAVIARLLRTNPQMAKLMKEGTGDSSHIWQDVIMALAAGYPDIDVLDALRPVMRKHNVSFDDLDQIAKEYGYDNVDAVYDEFDSNNLSEGKKAKPDYIDLDKDGDKKEPMKKAAQDAKKVKSVDESVFRTRKAKSQPRTLDDVGASRTVDLNPEFNKIDPMLEPAVFRKQAGKPMRTMSDILDKEKHTMSKKGNLIGEKAPPGAKAERMVKHIKTGYAKNGKLTDKERSIAYATAWKAHNAGKLEEDIMESTVRSMLAAGFTREQIVEGILKEGWAEMIAAADKREKDKGTGKFDKKSTHSGTVYTRKYDPDSGDTEEPTKDADTGGEPVKRGRGRPKGSKSGAKMVKPAGEKRGRGRPRKVSEGASRLANTMIVESLGNLFDAVTTTPPAKTYVAPKGGTVAPVSDKGVDTLIKSGDPNIYNKMKNIPTPSNPVPVVSDPEGVKEGDAELEEMMKLAGMEEGNFFTGRLAKARAAGKTRADLDGDGDMEPVKEGGVGTGGTGGDKSNTDEATCNECGMMESDCECDHDHAHVSESADHELNEMLRIAGLKECMGPVPTQDMQNTEGTMTISTNMSSTGTKNVTVTADGEAAVELMQMLKLAGVGGHDHEADHGHPEGVVVVDDGSAQGLEESKCSECGKDPCECDDDEDESQDLDEAKDTRYMANTTPEEHVKPVQALTQGGDGDVAGKVKKQHKHGYKFSDNPLAMSEGATLKLMREYDGIKVKK